MALTTPILYSISAFDATEEQIFNFNVVGGDQVVKNKLTIINQSDSSIAYEDTQTTFAFRHIVPANTLTNGEYYSATIVTYNSNDDESSPSDGIQFYCFSLPQFTFANIPVGGLINNSSYNFEVEYNQTENEMLNTYIYNLYDAQRNLLSTSGELYVGGSAILPLTVGYIFSGMEDNTNYYIQAKGQTIHGIQVDTGLISITVRYIVPVIFSIIELSNNCEGGYITIHSNLIGINGESNPSPPVYVDNNNAVDISGTGEYVLWSSGFTVDGDFTASLWGRDFNENSEIIFMTNNSQDLLIRYMKNEDDEYYAELLVMDGTLTYYIFSDAITVSSGDELQIWFRRIGNLYEIGLYNLG